MRKCKIIKMTGSNRLKLGNYYSYEIIENVKDSIGTSICLTFPYHIYDKDGMLIEVLNKNEFFEQCIDIQKNRKEKLNKINAIR